MDTVCQLTILIFGDAIVNKNGGLPSGYPMCLETEQHAQRDGNWQSQKANVDKPSEHGGQLKKNTQKEKKNKQ